MTERWEEIRDEIERQHMATDCERYSDCHSLLQMRECALFAACKRIAEMERENQALREAAHGVLMQGDMTAGGEWRRKGSILRDRVQILRRLVARVSLEDLGVERGGARG